jgi:hypothetical protein
VSSESAEQIEPLKQAKMRVSEVQKVPHFEVQKWITFKNEVIYEYYGAYDDEYEYAYYADCCA